MLHARSGPDFSLTPSLLLYAIGCSAHIISLLPISKTRSFGRPHVFLVLVPNPDTAVSEHLAFPPISLSCPVLGLAQWCIWQG
jgi:hypothetical protein